MRILYCIIVLLICCSCNTSLKLTKTTDLSIDIANPFQEFTRQLQFKEGSYYLLEAYTDEFKQIVAIINAYNSEGSYTFEISGHTDSVEDQEINQKLSQQRADKIKSILVVNGCHHSQLKAVGYGDTRPIDSNKTPEGRKKNMRIDIEVIPL